ncbi:DUF4175 family protein [Aestuariivivens sediminicola]|uniref:DUF4175 family protein n=1 Tax=Aestuariivivens sediminicola TaxID=2913560 RepID=UPI001F55BDE1|nr:DUF4175 family protein [Aestuariivivens sediminicola]
MTNFNNILKKLEQFVRKYYINELLKGSMLFVAIGLLYLMFILFLEYTLWLNPTARTILFWMFVSVEMLLLGKFIVMPLAKLFKIKKGINHQAASRIIGRHFPEVNDKLLNVLQLNQSVVKSELLLASIEQKSIELKPIPFRLAIDFRKNLKYLKYVAIPVAILLLSILFGNLDWFSESYTRVVHYRTPFEPPAPFHFFLEDEALSTLENKDYKLKVKTIGEIVPDNVQIQFNNESYFLQKTGASEFEYVFTKPKATIEFQLEANGLQSRTYQLYVVEVPSMVSFEMDLTYPPHTKKKAETIKNTGNVIVPEGTNINWNIKTKSTDEVHLYAKDSFNFSMIDDNAFSASKKVYRNMPYTISTSNENVNNYENLSFKINVVKDEYPELRIKVETDTLDQQSMYFYGQASDDYGLSKLQLVYYPQGEEERKKKVNIDIPASNVAQFVSAFPNNQDVMEGLPYELYFQVFDNDIVNNIKSSKSKTFYYRKRTRDEETQRDLKQQNETIEDMNNSLNGYKKQEERLKELTKTQKEKSILNFSDRKKLESFLKRQQQQDEMMKNFNKKLKDNLEDFQNNSEEPDQFNEDLNKRLEENEKQLEEDEKLLEELKKLQDKINQEQLVDKLEELAKQNKNKKRSLNQLLELMKRFYVEKKFEKLNDDLQRLGEEQENLSKTSKEENTKEKQEDLNERFENYKNDLDELEEENSKLKKPMDIPRDKLDENEVDKEQKKATDQLEEMDPKGSDAEEGDKKEDGAEQEEEQLNNVKESQKKAGQKMKQMSQKMQGAMQMGGGEQMQEDMEMLRQILDNLVVFSFDEEALMNRFKGIEINHNKYASYLRKQNDLKEHFEHIDDSLFALSLRQPKISEQVNKEITEVYFNMDKALELLAENQLYQGVSKQQFAITAANNLADFLSNILDNMQESLSMSPGKGKGDMQLPDIIMSQEELNKMMQEGLKDDMKGQSEKKGKEGDKNGEDREGEKGEKGNTEQGNGDKESEERLNGMLYEIYQRQQELRNALRDQLEKQGKKGVGDRILKDMEDVELELLNKGFTNRTLQKMMQLEHQLLKLENATFMQGEENKREAKTNRDTFNNQIRDQIPTAKEYFNSTEILNRQALPFNQEYKRKVKVYFNSEDD